MAIDSISLIILTNHMRYSHVLVRCAIKNDCSINILTYNTIKYNGDKHQEKEH